MNKEIAKKLQTKALDIAQLFSNKDREFNYSQEDFMLEEITPLSEKTAVITYKKTSGKKAIVFAYYRNDQGGNWQYFFPAESHIYGMLKLPKFLEDIEKHNFPLNE